MRTPGDLEEQKQFVSQCDELKDTPLHYAAKYGQFEVTKWLLNFVPDIIDARRSGGETALFDALRHSKIVKLLLEHVSTAKAPCGTSGIYRFVGEPWHVNAGNNM